MVRTSCGAGNQGYRIDCAGARVSPALANAFDKLGAYVAAYDAWLTSKADAGYAEAPRVGVNHALAELDSAVAALPAADYDLYRAQRDVVWRFPAARTQFVRDRAVRI